MAGKVEDVSGGALPGVAVGFAGHPQQALTNGRGEYQLPVEPGKAIQLEFIKTGYTPGRLDLTMDTARRAEAATVVLWPLPSNKGVFLSEQYRYIQLQAAEPRRYVIAEKGALHAVALTPEIRTESGTPLVMCFKMPNYDLACSQLIAAKGTPPDSPDPSYTVPVLYAGDPVPVTAEVIDNPDATLVQVQFSAPLAPGIYGVHWGALEGHLTTDPRVFVFMVRDPNAPPPEPAPAPGPEDAEKKGKGKEKAKESQPVVEEAPAAPVPEEAPVAMPEEAPVTLPDEAPVSIPEEAPPLPVQP